MSSSCTEGVYGWRALIHGRDTITARSQKLNTVGIPRQSQLYSGMRRRYADGMLVAWQYAVGIPPGILAGMRFAIGINWYCRYAVSHTAHTRQRGRNRHIRSQLPRS